MAQTTLFAGGPLYTPRIILKLIIFTCAVSISAALLDALLLQITGWSGIQQFLSLSWNTFHRLFLWQLATSFFIQQPAGGVTIYFLVMLLFNAYIVWIMGSAVVEQLGARAFLYLYLISGVIAGIVALLAMELTNSYMFLAGATPSIFAILMVWTMLFSEAELMLFFVIPLKAKWVLLALLGCVLLIDASQFNVVGFAYIFGGLCTGYFMGLANGLKGPFPFMAAFDHSVVKWAGSALSMFSPASEKSSKIIDFKTGQPMLDDEGFVDAMLHKISQYGESKLTKDERNRLDKIAQRKQREKGPKRF